MVCIATRESAKWSVHRSYSVRVRASVHPSDTSYRARGIRNLFPGRGGTEISNRAMTRSRNNLKPKTAARPASRQVAERPRSGRADVARERTRNGNRKQPPTGLARLYAAPTARYISRDTGLPGFNSFAAGYEPPP